MSYGFGKQVNLTFDAALERTTSALQQQGFGVLIDIDVAATMKKKLNLDMPPYRIEGSVGTCFVGARFAKTIKARSESNSWIPTRCWNWSVPEVTQLAGEVRQRLVNAMEAI